MSPKHNLTLPLTHEQYENLKFEFSQVIGSMEGMHSMLADDGTERYEVFPAGMDNLIEWARGETAPAGQVEEIRKVADKISVPAFFGDPHWVRQFTEEGLFDLVLAIATNSLNKL